MPEINFLCQTYYGNYCLKQRGIYSKHFSNSKAHKQWFNLACSYAIQETGSSDSTITLHHLKITAVTFLSEIIQICLNYQKNFVNIICQNLIRSKSKTGLNQKHKMSLFSCQWLSSNSNNVKIMLFHAIFYSYFYGYCSYELDNCIPATPATTLKSTFYSFSLLVCTVACKSLLHVRLWVQLQFWEYLMCRRKCYHALNICTRVNTHVTVTTLC